MWPRLLAWGWNSHQVRVVFLLHVSRQTYPVNWFRGKQWGGVHSYTIFWVHIPGRIPAKSNLLQIHNYFQFSFPSPWLVTILRLKSQSALLFPDSSRENRLIHTFLNVISAMWNANCLVQGLNSACRFHFLQW